MVIPLPRHGNPITTAKKYLVTPLPIAKVKKAAKIEEKTFVKNGDFLRQNDDFFVCLWVLFAVVLCFFLIFAN